ncbi:MAG: hypothetical protein V3U14_03990 [candidate division NC10 bacterium]
MSITINSDLLQLGTYPTVDTLGLIAKDRLLMAGVPPCHLLYCPLHRGRPTI